MNKTIICKDVFNNEFTVKTDDLMQRIGVYAVIIDDDKILLTRQWDGYSLVGGGVDNGENLEDALIREVYEETGLTITPGKLFYHTSTFFKKDSEAPAYQSFQFYFTHQTLSGEIDSTNITTSEQGYTNGVPEWVEINKLATINFRHSVNLETIMNAYDKINAVNHNQGSSL